MDDMLCTLFKAYGKACLVTFAYCSLCFALGWPLLALFFPAPLLGSYVYLLGKEL